ncbi:MAG: glycosyltransferase [Coriobacteriales bacterium]|jgi:glycosyltransferase involved in cell wall biosynthesis|nr:glycosyltransferase [Coriobacteriales bacterium]
MSRESINVSVALAACNGERYLLEQVVSILAQLGSEDELIISVDPSSDRTLELAQQVAQQSPQVVVLQGPGRGVAANFEQAIAATSREVILLSDQDDVWLPDKVDNVVDAFVMCDATAVVHDAELVDEQLRQLEPSFFAQRGTRQGFLRNLMKNSYMGCCMAFVRNFKPYILPFPEGIPAYDQWIGLLAENHGGVALITKPLLQHRLHGGNLTPAEHASPKQMLAWRRTLLKALQQREAEIRQR